MDAKAHKGALECAIYRTALHALIIPMHCGWETARVTVVQNHTGLCSDVRILGSLRGVRPQIRDVRPRRCVVVRTLAVIVPIQRTFGLTGMTKLMSLSSAYVTTKE